jgi:hypothetical protein
MFNGGIPRLCKKKKYGSWFLTTQPCQYLGGRGLLQLLCLHMFNGDIRSMLKKRMGNSSEKKTCQGIEKRDVAIIILKNSPW